MGALVVLVIGSAVFTLLGISFMCLARNQKVKTVIGYIMGVWGMIMAYLGATANPVNYIGAQVICWIGGFIAVAGILLMVTGKSPLVGRILVVISVVWGFVNAFLF